MITPDEPTPWTVGRYLVIDADGCIVARLARMISPQNAQIICHLFAAAPDLLEAAERACKALIERTPGSVPGGEQALEALQSAIVKARGLTPIQPH